MSVTTEDVAEAVKQLWNLASTLSDPSTGLVRYLVMGRVKDVPSVPYASFTVQDGPIERFANAEYLQTFTVEVRTWAADPVSLGEIQVAIEAAFTIRARTVYNLASGRNLKVLHCLKQPGGITEDDQTREAQAVKVSTDRYEFYCQG